MKHVRPVTAIERQGRRRLIVRPPDELLRLIGENDFSIADDIVKGRSQAHNRIHLLLHGNKEVGVHIGIKPLQIFCGVVGIGGKSISNLTVKGGIVHAMGILQRFFARFIPLGPGRHQFRPLSRWG